MKARDVFEYLRGLDGGWVDWQTTTDRFIAGDPDREVTAMAVAWMSTARALRQAVALGCSLFVTHEPTFFSHHDDEEAIFRFAGAREKRAWVRESRLAILRCHDVWDQYPEEGIPDSWARQLGLGSPMVAQGFFRVFDVSGQTAGMIAAGVAARTRSLGQEAVQLIGEADAPVSRLALGTGAITPFGHFVDTHDADIAICTDDGFTYWQAGALAEDLGIPVVIVNHAVSELPGIRALAAHLAARFPQVTVHHLEQRCVYRLIAPGS